MRRGRSSRRAKPVKAGRLSSRNHRRRHILVPEQLLHGPDFVPILQQVCREAVPGGMAAACLVHSCGPHCLLYRVAASSRPRDGGESTPGSLSPRPQRPRVADHSTAGKKRKHSATRTPSRHSGTSVLTPQAGTPALRRSKSSSTSIICRSRYATRRAAVTASRCLHPKPHRLVHTRVRTHTTGAP